MAFVSNTGGIGTTSLVYHLTWMYADLGLNVLAADLDPQASLSSMFLDEDRVESLWSARPHAKTLFEAMEPLFEGSGEVASPLIEDINDGLGLLVGDITLSSCEAELNRQWSRCKDGDARAFRVTSAIWRAITKAAEEQEANLVLIDVGPNLGAINRAVLIASDHIAMPLAPDLYSLHGLLNLGPTLSDWRSEWRDPYRSLMPLAEEARKSMFFLRAADGAIGGLAQAVLDCHHDFRSLAKNIAERCGIALPY